MHLDRGKIAVLSMFALAIGAATFAWFWNYRRGERCLAFYGSEAATLIRTAPTVEILEVDPADPLAVTRRIDISHAPGLLNARAALLDDASFIWGARPEPAEVNPTRLLRFANADREVRLRLNRERLSLEILPDGNSAVLDAKTSAGWQQFLDRYK
jgi:hypothetical protein